jgi:hypothetical protein
MLDDGGKKSKLKKQIRFSKRKLFVLSMWKLTLGYNIQVQRQLQHIFVE